MAIQSGTHLGPYEILSAIGAGGMGEVYRARDPKLGRDVAIKVLPEAFARDAERMARFQREAKVLASLSHPNIATIYGLEDSGGTQALVMELVEGPTLADHIGSRRIAVDEALRIAKQVCDALEYAHERGVVHRDFKPANIKVSPDDAVKILDFGLAKVIEGYAAEADSADSGTLSAVSTIPGILLGTASYMSPEQAKGRSVDRRADIWAFGCVLYEMLTGKMAFRGETVTETLAAILQRDPDWSQLPAATPLHLAELLRRCLQKEVRHRLQAIGDARIALEEVLSGTPEQSFVSASAPFKRPAALPWVLFGVMTIAFAAVMFVHFVQKPSGAAAPVQRYEFAAPDPTVDSVGALSPDGTRLVLRNSGGGPNRLWLRRMDLLEAHPLEGTEDANGVPFWSPDSRFIAFGTADGKLKKIGIEGGPAQVLCDVGGLVFDGFWTRDSRIIFSDPARKPGLWQVPVTGGVSSPLPGVEHAGDPYVYGPALLPDGRHFLYSSGVAASADVYLGSLDSNAGKQSSKKLLTGIFNNARYAPSPNDRNLGYLLFVRDSATHTLVAQPFDLRNLELAGEPVPIAEQVSWWNFSASLTGTLVYVSGAYMASTGQLTVFDRYGKFLTTAGDPGNYDSVAFSPDGRRVVAALFNNQSGSENLWMMDLVRNIGTRFTFDSASDTFPVWSPDGNRIVFASNRDGSDNLYQKLSNGGGEDELLLKPDHAVAPVSFSGDGRFLLLRSGSSVPNQEAFVLPLDASGHAAGKPFVFVQKGVGIEERFSPGPEGHPRWVAYSSNESGKFEIYVRPFDPNSPTGTPPGGGKWQVSTDGGFSPRWNSNGKELFYVAPEGTVTSVEVTGNGVFHSGLPVPRFRPKSLVLQPSGYFDWDASSDGQKFIFSVSQPASASTPPTEFTVVLNWPSLLRK